MMNKIIIGMLLAVATLISGCATQKTNHKTPNESMVVSQDIPAGMVAIDTVEGFKARVFKAISAVESYEEQSACCLWDNSKDGVLHVKKFLLDEVVYQIKFLNSYEDVIRGYRTWDSRILPYSHTLPYYEQELAKVKNILAKEKPGDNVIEGFNGQSTKPQKTGK